MPQFKDPTPPLILNGIFTGLPLDNPIAFGYTMCGGMIPHTTQIDFITSPAKEKIGCCGRRWGKTKGEALETIMWSLKNPETETFIVAPSQDQANIIFAMIETMMEGVLSQFITNLVHSPFPSMELINGSKIHARSVGYDGKYLRGHHADRVVYDECAFLPTRIVEEVVPQMMITSLFGKVVKIGTPFGKNHFYDSFQKGQTGDPRYQSFRNPSWTNPYVNRETLEEERLHRTKLAWDVEYCARFRDDQTTFFRWGAVKQCINDDDLEWPVDPIPGHQYVIGFDPARINDRSAICVLDYTSMPWKVVYLQDIHGRSFGIQEEMVKTISERYNNAPVHTDTTRHDQLGERLVDIVPEAYSFVFTNENKFELHEGTALAFEHKELQIPRHPDLLREIQFFEMKASQASNVMKLGAPEGSNHYDDYVTSLALAMSLARHRVNYAPAEVSMLSM